MDPLSNNFLRSIGASCLEIPPRLRLSSHFLRVVPLKKAHPMQDRSSFRETQQMNFAIFSGRFMHCKLHILIIHCSGSLYTDHERSQWFGSHKLTSTVSQTSQELLANTLSSRQNPGRWIPSKSTSKENHRRYLITIRRGFRFHPTRKHPSFIRTRHRYHDSFDWLRCVAITNFSILW